MKPPNLRVLPNETGQLISIFQLFYLNFKQSLLLACLMKSCKLLMALKSMTAHPFLLHNVHIHSKLSKINMRSKRAKNKKKISCEKFSTFLMILI
jgi:hypothetical protein